MYVTRATPSWLKMWTRVKEYKLYPFKLVPPLKFNTATVSDRPPSPVGAVSNSPLLLQLSRLRRRYSKMDHLKYNKYTNHTIQ